jgi:hypothetical protein
LIIILFIFAPFGIYPGRIFMQTENRKNYLSIILIILYTITCKFNLLQAQENRIEMSESSRIQTIQDSNKKLKSGKIEYSTEPVDTNFTFEKYADFLRKISDTSKYVVLPIDEFRKKIDSNKIVIGLRHDVDNDLKVARKFSKTEKDLGFRSTYYILHTANYYLADPSNKAVHSDSIIAILKDMQDRSGFEIAWHNDLVTLQVVYHIDPVKFLHQELSWLRANGIKITGTSSHGSPYCKVFYYLNYYFFEECTWPIVPPYVNNISVPDGAGRVNIQKGKLSDFNLEYEAYFLNNNKYFSDASITNGIRWNIGMLDLNSLKKGDRVIILLHPIHWHQAYTAAAFVRFSVPGQLGCTINEQDQTVRVVLPTGSDRSNMVPTYVLPSGAYAKISGSMQTSGSSRVNFNNPVTYTIYAENRSITKTWTVTVDNTKSNATDFEAFSIPGSTKQVSIDPVSKSILVKVYSKSSIKSLPVQFRLSPGATAWIGSVQQFSNSGTVDFSKPVHYRIVAEDGITVTRWSVTVEMLNSGAGFTSFKIPGMTKDPEIRPESQDVNIEVRNGQLLYDLPAFFGLSGNAKAYVKGIEQNSGISMNSFYSPVVYNIVSEDSLTVNNWKVSVRYESFLSARNPDSVPTLSIYPNPTRGKAILKLTNITEAEPRIEIFNSIGRKIYYSVVQSASVYFKEIDLSDCPPGIYVAKCSSVSQPAVFFLDRE